MKTFKGKNELLLLLSCTLSLLLISCGSSEEEPESSSSEEASMVGTPDSGDNSNSSDTSDIPEHSDSLDTLAMETLEDDILISEVIEQIEFTPIYSLTPEEMLSICQLAVLEYQYNNVAIYEETVPVFLLSDKKVHFWIQYTGIVKVGVDISDVSISITENIVEIALPPMEVLSCKVDERSFTPNSYIYHPDSQEADVDTQRTVLAQANAEMLQQVSNDTASMKLAKTRVELLLTNYIQSVGQAIGVEYEIRWV